MKKLCALLLALMMCFALVACGGVDKQPAIDAFNSANTQFTELANMVNENIGAYPQEAIDVMMQMSDALSQSKDLLESDQELTEENVAELVASFNEIETWAVDAKAELEVYSTGADKQPAIDAFNSANTAFTEIATAINENIDAFDEEFVNTMIEMSEILSVYKSGLEGDMVFTEDEINEMVEQFTLIEEWVDEVKYEVFG